MVCVHPSNTPFTPGSSPSLYGFTTLHIDLFYREPSAAPRHKNTVSTDGRDHVRETVPLFTVYLGRGHVDHPGGEPYREISHTHKEVIQLSPAHSSETVCLPLSCSGNPGVNGESEREGGGQ